MRRTLQGGDADGEQNHEDEAASRTDATHSSPCHDVGSAHVDAGGGERDVKERERHHVDAHDCTVLKVPQEDVRGVKR